MRLLIVLLLILSGPLAAREAPIGMVTDLTAPVRVGDGAADLLVQVAPGDEIVAEAGGSCTVTWYSDGHRETVRGPARVRVTAAGLQGAGVERTAASPALAGLSPPTPREPGPTKRGTIDSMLTMPGEARVPLPLPLIELPPGVERMEVRSPRGEVLYSEVLMGGSTWGVPERKLPKSVGPGTRLRIVALGPGGVEMASRQVVLTESSAQLKELAVMQSRSEATPWIARARRLEQAGCRELALDAVLEALSRSRSPALLAWAADLCEGLGRSAEARAFRAMAASR